MDGFVWGVMAPDQLEPKRAGLDLGLRTPLLHYADMSVPGIGGVFFVRQLVWPCLAIGLSHGGDVGHRRISTARLATAIEALACKLWLEEHDGGTRDDRKGRVAGVRTLPDRGWTFRELGTKEGYVSNPKRRAATRALPEGSGLGFTSGGLRLDRMTLTQLGDELVADGLERRLFFKHEAGEWFREWIDGGGREVAGKLKSSLREALDPFTPTPREKHVVQAALRYGEDGRRRRLIERLEARGLSIHSADVEGGLLAHLPTIQAAQIRTAWAFRRLTTAAQATVRCMAAALPTLDTRLSPVTLSARAGDALNAARDAARHFLALVHENAALRQDEAVRFAQFLVEKDPREALGDLVLRAGPLFRLDGDAVMRGPAFSDRWLSRQDDEEGDGVATAPGDGDLPLRLPELLSLLADCKEA